MTIRREALSYELGPDAVHVWYVFPDRVTDPAVLERSLTMMSPDERTRRDRFVFSKDRHQYLVSRGFVRTLLARYAGIRPEECVFVVNRYGKPALRRCGSAAPDLRFNLSHTNGLVALAVTAGREVGLDIEEHTRARVDVSVRRFFSAAEISALEELPEADQRSRFFDYWTLKEAYVKARGLGLSLPLDSFAMHLDATGPPTITCESPCDDDPSRWQFVLYDPSPRHRMALAICRRGADASVTITECELARLSC
jgi:4'-phosphopantetheinyl transferase